MKFSLPGQLNGPECRRVITQVVALRKRLDPCFAAIENSDISELGIAHSLVRTDGSWAYHKLEKYGYRRDKTVMLGATEPAHVTMPGVHRVASLLKRWLMGTHQGSVKPKQLDYYLDEFTFRFNRRTSKSRGLLFYRLLQQTVVTEPVTYEQITAVRDRVY